VLRRKDDSVFNADVAIAPLQEGGYKTVELICSIRDISERKRMELELRNALEQERDLSELKSRFVTTASHEFRTPLTLMLGPLEEVLPDAQERLGPDRHEQLVTVRRNALRLLKLVNTLLDFSRIEAGRVQAVYRCTTPSTWARDRKHLSGWPIHRSASRRS